MCRVQVANDECADTFLRNELGLAWRGRARFGSRSAGFELCDQQQIASIQTE
jgi:hypothetical protein